MKLNVCPACENHFTETGMDLKHGFVDTMLCRSCGLHMSRKDWDTTRSIGNFVLRLMEFTERGEEKKALNMIRRCVGRRLKVKF